MKKVLITVCIFGIGIGVSQYAFAAVEYRSITNLPMPSSMENTSTEEFIRILYMLSISLGGLLAVIKIIFGGVQYMLSDVITDKSMAKKDIQGAIFGLLIILSAVLILDTINPRITNLNLFGNAPAVSIQQGGQSVSTACGPNETLQTYGRNRQTRCVANSSGAAVLTCPEGTRPTNHRGGREATCEPVAQDPSPANEERLTFGDRESYLAAQESCTADGGAITDKREVSARNGRTASFSFTCVN